MKIQPVLGSSSSLENLKVGPCASKRIVDFILGHLSQESFNKLLSLQQTVSSVVVEARPTNDSMSGRNCVHWILVTRKLWYIKPIANQVVRQNVESS